MVSTRQHPREFPAPDASPTKGSPRKSSRHSTPSSDAPSNASPSASTNASLAKRAAANSSSITASPSAYPADAPWAHTASNITLAWLCLSIPLVIWDALYILLRPHTMAGGFLQWPIWKPYEVYAAIDHVYGWPGWESNDGFGGAQGALNVVETVLYGLYVMIVWNHGVPAASGTGARVEGKEQEGGIGRWLAGGRRVKGRVGNRAVLIGFAGAVMTLSKTVLYYFNEYFSGFHNVKHNDVPTLIAFYGVMNGLWVFFPAYMTIVFGSDLLQGLDLAVEATSKKQN